MPSAPGVALWLRPGRVKPHPAGGHGAGARVHCSCCSAGSCPQRPDTGLGLDNVHSSCPTFPYRPSGLTGSPLALTSQASIFPASLHRPSSSLKACCLRSHHPATTSPASSPRPLASVPRLACVRCAMCCSMYQAASSFLPALPLSSRLHLAAAGRHVPGMRAGSLSSRGLGACRLSGACTTCSPHRSRCERPLATTPCVGP